MSNKDELIQGSIEAALQHGIDVNGRRVFMHGGVDEGTIGMAIRGMYMLAGISREPIELIISSYGGDLDEAFALHDVTRTLKVPITTLALGKCMSAAPILVACGQRGERYATENTLFMLHDAELDVPGDSTSNIRESVRVTEEMMARYATLLSRYTKKRDKRFWLRIFARKHDTFFGAEQALEWGIIDQIWSEKD